MLLMQAFLAAGTVLNSGSFATAMPPLELRAMRRSAARRERTTTCEPTAFEREAPGQSPPCAPITAGRLSRDVAAAGSTPEPPAAAPRAAEHEHRAALPPAPHNEQTQIVLAYLSALRADRYDQAFGLLDSAERSYYRTPANVASVYAADRYHISGFSVLGARGDDRVGRVYFVRETARFRDHAHDVDLTVAATVPLGVVPERKTWRIKDPGHPWRAFATTAGAARNDVRVRVKKVSFFRRRIEVVLTIADTGSRAVTILAYGKSVLRERNGTVYRPIETRDWSLTDKTLFEGLRLPPNAQYTGTLTFACPPLDDARRTFALTLAPLLMDGGDLPFAVDVRAIAADARAQ